ncbi:hypothetical protein BJX63DRAFT_120742 [Aspergillus granulosus]|uniref:Ubiquitinyl hydrolase 1 n=1 Tax=Aspergillus granulosus TaxID=176169 RepID=A0ABR4GT18_9EURO
MRLLEVCFVPGVSYIEEIWKYTRDIEWTETQLSELRENIFQDSFCNFLPLESEPREGKKSGSDTFTIQLALLVATLTLRNQGKYLFLLDSNPATPPYQEDRGWSIGICDLAKHYWNLRLANSQTPSSSHVPVDRTNDIIRTTNVSQEIVRDIPT